jgi:transposase
MLDTNLWGFFMSKYSEEFKLSVVQQYLGGVGGFKAIARQHGLCHSVVRRWVLWYQAYGTEGLKKKFTHYSAEFKLSVLQRIWDDELSYGQAAIAFDIRNPGVLGVWERVYRSGGIDALRSRPKGKPRQMTIAIAKPEPKPKPDDENRSHDELLAELNHLRMENAYLKKLRALVQAQQKATPPKKRK